MASGTPSSVRQMSVTAATFLLVKVKLSRASVARWINSCIASYATASSTVLPRSGRDNDGTRQVISPGNPSGSRLVASTRKPSPPRSKVETASAHSFTRCSQLSRMIRVFVPSRARTSAFATLNPCSSLAPTALATASRTRPDSSTGTRSTNRTPSGKFSSSSAPT